MLEMFYFRYSIRPLNSHSGRKDFLPRVLLADLQTGMLGTSGLLSIVIDSYSTTLLPIINFLNIVSAHLRGSFILRVLEVFT